MTLSDLQPGDVIFWPEDSLFSTTLIVAVEPLDYAEQEYRYAITSWGDGVVAEAVIDEEMLAGVIIVRGGNEFQWDTNGE